MQEVCECDVGRARADPQPWLASRRTHERRVSVHRARACIALQRKAIPSELQVVLATGLLMSIMTHLQEDVRQIGVTQASSRAVNQLDADLRAAARQHAVVDEVLRSTERKSTAAKFVCIEGAQRPSADDSTVANRAQ